MEPKRRTLIWRLTQKLLVVVQMAHVFQNLSQFAVKGHTFFGNWRDGGGWEWLFETFSENKAATSSSENILDSCYVRRSIL